MKSLALSLLVALGLTLGAGTASADPTGGRSAAAFYAAAQTATNEANVHAQKANQLRLAARAESDTAQQFARIADNDMKQGFTYEAGVARDKARAHQAAASGYLASANKEDLLAAQYRAAAQQDLNTAHALQGPVNPGFAIPRH